MSAAPHLAEQVRRHAIVSHAFLCPEIALYLVTDSCPLWKADDNHLARIGLESPYWAFAWAGGQALARYILDHPEHVRGKAVLDLGSGGAIEGIAALMAGATRVLCSDIDPLACAAAELNAGLNGVTLETTTFDLLSGPAPLGIDWDLVLVGDVTYDETSAARVLDFLRLQVAQGKQALLADPERGFLASAGLRALTQYQAPADVDVDGRILVSTPIYLFGAESG